MSDRNFALSLSRFCKWCLAAIFALVLAGSTSIAHADPTYTLAPISLAQTGLSITSIGGGLSQWDTTLQVTNTSANPIYNVSFVQFTALVSDDGGSNSYYGTWDNSTQQWELTSPYDATISVSNAAFYLSQSQTDVTFPAGDESDSFPLISVAGVILPGNSASFDVLNDLSNNVDVYYFNGDFLDTPTPEPGALSLMLLGCCAGGCFAYLRRRKFAVKTLPCLWRI
jgi:hypothetical protein